MKFSDLKLPPAVADALAARGYETATPVQAAVLDVGCVGRDLLVSSQTGSGKTIAFGAAIAQTLLGSGPADRAAAGVPEAFRPGASPDPSVLVVVPTRELAVQVRDELGWLLARTGLKMAAFTGGTAISGDLRVLHQGVDLVIGTPGRLCDLLRRDRLSLGSVRMVVLDEGDEMLDLGFREDLQTLLQAAPASRQTLLLSATLPPEIQALARRFQRDALRIDPRRTAGASGAPSPHGDITYVAHLIAGADRLPTVVNVLRASEAGRAIVFCTTREGVSRLHAALVGRGFAATAISGDRAQAERDRALEQLRRGEARVLVATNVAARGLHLPDVDLIVHADLPLNAESLTHRSGRTGRAGRKGTAVLLASLSERRKAERLLAAAHVPAVWTPAPSAETITVAARERLFDELVAKEVPADAGGDGGLDQAIGRLTERLPVDQLVRRLLARELARLPTGEVVHPVAMPKPGSARGRDTDDRRRPARADFRREGALFTVNLGASQNADPRWLLPLICRRGGVTRRDVGAIRVGPDATTFEIAGDAAEDFALAAAEIDPRAPQVIIARQDGVNGVGGVEGVDAEPPRAPRPPRPPRPTRPDRGPGPARPRPNLPPIEMKRAPHPARPPGSTAAALARSATRPTAARPCRPPPHGRHQRHATKVGRSPAPRALAHTFLESRDPSPARPFRRRPRLAPQEAQGLAGRDQSLLAFSKSLGASYLLKASRDHEAPPSQIGLSCSLCTRGVRRPVDTAHHPGSHVQAPDDLHGVPARRGGDRDQRAR
jgi:ATP-dependent RNA helicase DeaD